MHLLNFAFCYRVVYFFLQQSPIQFKVCAIFQLSIDCGKFIVTILLHWLISNTTSAIIAQRIYYGNKPPATSLTEEDDIEQALVLAEE